MICAIIIAANLGGSVSDTAAVIRWAEAARCEVQITGDCASACVMLLRAGCIGPKARLGFHAPTRDGRTLRGADRAAWVQRMASHMPKAMARWYVEGPAHGGGVVWISAADAVALGARRC